MADSKELIKPRRKRRRFTRPEYPFPVPEQCSKVEDKWYYYQGFLRDNCVTVENIGDLTLLYKMGFFGKGILSRSKPEHEKISNVSQLAFSNSDRLRRLPPNERRIRQSKFRKCRKERFLQHMKWSKMCHSSDEKEVLDSKLENQSSDEDTEQGIEEDSSERQGAGIDNDDYVRIDDVLQELVNKDVKQPKDSENPGKPDKPDPYKIYEFLQLTFEEAFFLSFGLGCLSVITTAEEKLSLSTMWSEFSRRNVDFVRNYIAYHYYRSKGWVPQAGLKYGTDLVLYKKGMPFFHSSYAVVTTMVNEKGDHLESEMNISSGGKWTWKNLISLNRLNEHVAKEVLLFSVTIPTGTTAKELEHPSIVKNCKVQELVMRRWIPKRERERSSAVGRGWTV
ncbi:tRNA-splicing endonuclease subunit Sen2-like [Dendronephthya gigantea]|uniref:tRNA-splicing endonuclease subunit Sen2-like n=1 Tax=Dendronephthya gigantea TaxID=151771 RepID=UPI00106AEABC|nr:tRNA-splicing endonuclease subunit Sen2-like [Dendronephthya gigantea]